MLFAYPQLVPATCQANPGRVPSPPAVGGATPRRVDVGRAFSPPLGSEYALPGGNSAGRGGSAIGETHFDGERWRVGASRLSWWEGGTGTSTTQRRSSPVPLRVPGRAQRGMLMGDCLIDTVLRGESDNCMMTTRPISCANWY